MSHRRTRTVGVLLLACGSLVGCAASPAVQAARDRNIPKLDTALRAEEKAGDLDGGEARDVARALAKSEIEEAKGNEGVTLIRSLEACAPALEGALDDRAGKDDEVAAAAAGLMLSTKLVASDEYASFAVKGDARPMFRALGARSLVTEGYVGLRLPLFRDLDERVRLAALAAAGDYSSPGDFAALVDAARLDPLPDARYAATRAVGLIGGADAVHALRDLWTSADTSGRRAIAEAWASTKSYDAGGHVELLWAAQNDNGEGRIAASLALVHLAPKDSEDYEIGLGVLTRAIKLGTRQERVFAISTAPTAPPVLEAVRAAKDDSDPGVSIIAWSRLHTEGTDEEKKASLEKLLVIAKTDDPEAARAQEELAWFGDARVEPLLSKQLEAPNPFARALGARGLVALGRLPKAARVLADKDADVRIQTACAILTKRN